MDISSIRKEYTLQSLSEQQVEKEPHAQFSKWWQQALDSHIEEVNAMTLATVNGNGFPSARIVLLKGFDEKGFVFFTNYESRKGKELDKNPFASLLFFWKELERQVRMEGMIKKISESESEAYFRSRPLESQLGAWASPQSSVIPDREFLENRFVEMTEKWKEKEIVKPPHWGGYRLVAERMEFWQGRPGRLHDRILYEKKKEGDWSISRLAP